MCFSYCVICLFPFCLLYENLNVFVGPCHHGNARPEVADGGTASDVEGNCE